MKNLCHNNVKYEYLKSFQVVFQKNSTCTKYDVDIYKSDNGEILHTEMFHFLLFNSIDHLIDNLEKLYLNTNEYDSIQIIFNNLIKTT